MCVFGGGDRGQGPAVKASTSCETRSANSPYTRLPPTRRPQGRQHPHTHHAAQTHARTHAPAAPAEATPTCCTQPLSTSTCAGGQWAGGGPEGAVARDENVVQRLGDGQGELEGRHGLELAAQDLQFARLLTLN